MMIAARLAGGNLFLPFLGGGFFWWGIFWWGIFGSTRSSSDFFEGDFVVGDFWEHSEHSEQLVALGFFLRGFVVGGFFFLGGGGVFWIVSVGKN